MLLPTISMLAEELGFRFPWVGASLKVLLVPSVWVIGDGCSTVGMTQLIEGSDVRAKPWVMWAREVRFGECGIGGGTWRRRRRCNGEKVTIRDLILIVRLKS